MSSQDAPSSVGHAACLLLHAGCCLQICRVGPQDHHFPGPLLCWSCLGPRAASSPCSIPRFAGEAHTLEAKSGRGGLRGPQVQLQDCRQQFTGHAACTLPVARLSAAAKPAQRLLQDWRQHHRGSVACTLPAARLSAAAKQAQWLLQGAGEGACSTAALRSTNVALGMVCWWLLLQSYRMLHPGITGSQALTMVSATACACLI